MAQFKNRRSGKICTGKGASYSLDGWHFVPGIKITYPSTANRTFRKGADFLMQWEPLDDEANQLIQGKKIDDKQ